MINQYELIILVEGIKRKVNLVASHENWHEYDFRIKRELFGSLKPKEYKVISHKIIKTNLGLI